MKVAVSLLLKRNAEEIAVELATFFRVVDDGTKTCDEKDLNLCGARHDVSSC